MYGHLGTINYLSPESLTPILISMNNLILRTTARINGTDCFLFHIWMRPCIKVYKNSSIPCRSLYIFPVAAQGLADEVQWQTGNKLSLLLPINAHFHLN